MHPKQSIGVSLAAANRHPSVYPEPTVSTSSTPTRVTGRSAVGAILPGAPLARAEAQNDPRALHRFPVLLPATGEVRYRRHSRIHSLADTGSNTRITHAPLGEDSIQFGRVLTLELFPVGAQHVLAAEPSAGRHRRYDADRRGLGCRPTTRKVAGAVPHRMTMNLSAPSTASHPRRAAVPSDQRAFPPTSPNASVDGASYS